MLTLVEDYKLRKYLLETLSGAGVPKVEIERDAKRVRINIHCAKPGMVIGKQGAEIEKLRALCAKKLGKELNEVYINIVEIKQPDLNATLVAQYYKIQKSWGTNALCQSAGVFLNLGGTADKKIRPKLQLAV